MTEFESIYQTYFQDVYRYLLRVSRNEHIAEEVTSETFFKAMQSVKQFRGECEIRVWLCQIAKNCYFSYMKKSRRMVSMNDPEFPEMQDLGTNVEEIITGQDEVSHLKRILHQIPEPYKEVFMWRVFAEMSFKQIGQIFQKSENWACVTYHRARKMINERMEEQGNEK